MTNSIHLFLIVLLGATKLYGGGNDWPTERFGRPNPDQLVWSVDPQEVSAFLPSGIGNQILRCGDFTLQHNHAIYHANEENTDTNYDQRACVIVYKGNQRVFVARGNQFTRFQFDADKNAVTFDYWTGVMGARQVQQLTLDLSGSDIECSTRYFSTKDPR